MAAAGNNAAELDGVELDERAALAAGPRPAGVSDRKSNVVSILFCSFMAQDIGDRLFTMPALEVYDMVTMDLAGRLKSNCF